MVDEVDAVDVLVVGAGPTGLSAAVALGRLGVSTLVVERRDSTSTHPRAHVINARTMELLRLWGIDMTTLEASVPPERGIGIGFSTRLARADLADIRFTDDLDSLMTEAVKTTSIMCSCPQDRFEPILLDTATAFPDVTVRFGHELLEVRQDDDGVDTDIRSDDGVRTVRARYVIAADGGHSRLREQLGIGTTGGAPLGHEMSVYFRADLRRYIEERPFFIYWVLNPDAPGAFVAIDGSERWIFHLPYDAGKESAEDYPAERCAALVRAAIGVGDVDVDVISVLPWTLGVTIAERFREGRVFLAGDAAHTFPPTGGFGMNTGIADVHNLTWKLAAAIAGAATDELLDTYEPERKPVAEFNAEQSVLNTQRMIESGLGLAMTADPASLALIEQPEGEELRARLTAAIPAQAEHFRFQGQAFGYQYESAAVVPDGSAPTPSTVSDYIPTARPGARAPHIWLQSPDGQHSTLDLVDGHFTVLTGLDGADWCDAASQLAATVEVPLTAHAIADDAWPELYGVTPAGAVLVRPDGHVGWRHPGPSDEPLAALTAALTTILTAAPVPA